MFDGVTSAYLLPALHNYRFTVPRVIALTCCRYRPCLLLLLVVLVTSSIRLFRAGWVGFLFLLVILSLCFLLVVLFFVFVFCIFGGLVPFS